MSEASFVCGRCRKVMCSDCQQIADEYAELLKNRTWALGAANHTAEQAAQENEHLKRELQAWKEIAQLGLPEVMKRWMESQVARSAQPGPRCADCGTPYESLGLDTVLPNAQWELVSGRSDGGGILCASCIVKRASRIPGATVAHVVIEIGPLRTAF